MVVVFLAMYLLIKYSLVIHRVLTKRRTKLNLVVFIDLLILALIVAMALYLNKQMGYIF